MVLSITHHNRADGTLGEGTDPRSSPTIPWLNLEKPPVLSIDGGAGTGKSRIAHDLSVEFGGIPVLDSGKLFRAIGLAAMRSGIDPESLKDASLNGDRVREFVSRVSFVPDSVSRSTIVVIVQPSPDDLLKDPKAGGIVHRFDDVELEGAAAASAASVLGQYRVVRETLCEVQREVVRSGSITPGRAQGTELVGADFEKESGQPVIRVFLWAELDVVARRRLAQWERESPTTRSDAEREEALQELRRQISERDARDSGREIAPLLTKDRAEALGYVVIDTSARTPGQVVQEIKRALLSRVPELDTPTSKSSS